jgi:hypothetical protein
LLTIVESERRAAMLFVSMLCCRMIMSIGLRVHF